MYKRVLNVVVIVLLSCLVACNAAVDPSLENGSADVLAQPDSVQPAEPDTATPDGTTSDLQMADSESTDVAHLDTTTPDTSNPDTSTPDTSTPDSEDPPPVDEYNICQVNGWPLEDPLPVNVKTGKKGRQYLNFKYLGEDRPYVLHIPPGYDHQSPRPVLLMFHGGNWTAEGYYKSYQELKHAVDKSNMIMVLPQGIGKTWRGAHCCGRALQCRIDDVGYVRALAAYLQSVLKIDGKRLYAMGHSNGGMFCHRLAAEAPDLFAAVVPGAGTIGGWTKTDPEKKVVKPTGPIPMLLYHGRNDGSVRYNGGYSGGDGERYDMSFAKSTELWVKTNGCDPKAYNEKWDGLALIRRYTGCVADLVTISISKFGHGRPVDVEGFNVLVPVFKYFDIQVKP